MSEDRTRYVPCPLELVGEPWESAWQEAQGQLREQGTWRITDAPVLESMIRARRMAHEAAIEARAEPYVTGSSGQMVAHPAFALAVAHERLATLLADRLMLTASRRVTASVDAGKSDEPPRDEFDTLEDELAPRRGAKGAKGGRSAG